MHITEWQILMRLLQDHDRRVQISDAPGEALQKQSNNFLHWNS